MIQQTWIETDFYLCLLTAKTFCFGSFLVLPDPHNKEFTWMTTFFFFPKSLSHHLRSGDHPLSRGLLYHLLIGLPSPSPVPPCIVTRTLHFIHDENAKPSNQLIWGSHILASSHTGSLTKTSSLLHNPSPRNTAIRFAPRTCHILFPVALQLLCCSLPEHYCPPQSWAQPLYTCSVHFLLHAFLDPSSPPEGLYSEKYQRHIFSVPFYLTDFIFSSSQESRALHTVI